MDTETITTRDIDQALHGYLTCALWSEPLNRWDGDDTSFLSNGYDASDVHPSALSAMREDVASFMRSGHAQHDRDVAEWVKRYGADDLGHNLWLTRNHHGCGFWDRGAGDLGERLTGMAEPYGDASLYLGDDNMIYAE